MPRPAEYPAARAVTATCFHEHVRRMLERQRILGRLEKEAHARQAVPIGPSARALSHRKDGRATEVLTALNSTILPAINLKLQWFQLQPLDLRWTVLE